MTKMMHRMVVNLNLHQLWVSQDLELPKKGSNSKTFSVRNTGIIFTVEDFICSL